MFSKLFQKASAKYITFASGLILSIAVGRMSPLWGLVLLLGGIFYGILVSKPATWLSSKLTQKWHNRIMHWGVRCVIAFVVVIAFWMIFGTPVVDFWVSDTSNAYVVQTFNPDYGRPRDHRYALLVEFGVRRYGEKADITIDLGNSWII